MEKHVAVTSQVFGDKKMLNGRWKTCFVGCPSNSLLKGPQNGREWHISSLEIERLIFFRVSWFPSVLMHCWGADSHVLGNQRQSLLKYWEDPGMIVQGCVWGVQGLVLVTEPVSSQPTLEFTW